MQKPQEDSPGGLRTGAVRGQSLPDCWFCLVIALERGGLGAGTANLARVQMRKDSKPSAGLPRGFGWRGQQVYTAFGSACSTSRSGHTEAPGQSSGGEQAEFSTVSEDESRLWDSLLGERGTRSEQEILWRCASGKQKSRHMGRLGSVAEPRSHPSHGDAEAFK